MLRLIYFFMIFALSLATDVSVYHSYEAYYGATKPVFESVFPWKFEFTSSDQLNMGIYHINKPPGVIVVTVSYESDLVTFDTKILTLSNGRKVTVFVRQLNGSEAIINLDLHTSHGLCTSIRVAEGRVVSNKSEKEYKHTDICFKGSTKPCMLVADLKNLICNGPSNVTQKNENLKTTTPLTDPFVSNDSSTHETINTSTNSSANKTDLKRTNNTVIIIVGSLSGITLILLAIIAIRKRCWMLHSSQGISDLPTNQNNQPFYVNLLFRRECAEEIAEIEQHHYEEIAPQVRTEGG